MLITGALGVEHWGRIFDPDTPLVELVARGSIVYLTLFVVLRVVLNREASGLGITDLLVVVLIADATQNGMAGSYQSVTDGLLLAATIIGWSYLLDWVSFRFAAVRRLIEPPPLALVKDGKPLYRNMRRELISLDELRSQARLQGVDDLATITRAQMESDGQISIIANDSRGTRGRSTDAG